MKTLDEEILKELRENARVKLKNLAKKLGTPLSTIYSRIKKMEREGIIKRYTIQTNWKKLGFSIKAYVVVYFDNTRLFELNKTQEEILQEIRKLPYVFEADRVTGEGDFIVKVRAKDPQHLGEVLERIQKLPGIRNTQTYVAISEGN